MFRRMRFERRARNGRKTKWRGLRSAVGSHPGAESIKLRKAQKAPGPKSLLALAAAAALIAAILLDRMFTAPFLAASEQLVKRKASELLERAVSSVMSEYQDGYSEKLSHTELLSDGSGAIYINSAALAVISSRITREAQDAIEQFAETGVSLPLGTVSGASLLNGRGPGIRVGIEPIGAVTGRFSSAFTSAGVNQTLYSAKLELNASIRIIIAGKQHDVTASALSPILETIVVGNVPHAYTDVASFEDALNLIPTDAD